MSRTPRPIPVLTDAEIARFRAKVGRGAKCRLWQGEAQEKGYGVFRIYRGERTIKLLAHRVAFKLATGIDPGILIVRHGCDTPLCCAPACLSIGTQADNIADAMARERLDLTGLTKYRDDREARVRARIAVGEKSCGTCRKTKPFSEFGPYKRSIDGLRPSCRECSRAYQREWERRKKAGLSENARLELRNPGWRGRKMAQRRREAVAS